MRVGMFRAEHYASRNDTSWALCDSEWFELSIMRVGMIPVEHYASRNDTIWALCESEWYELSIMRVGMIRLERYASRNDTSWHYVSWAAWSVSYPTLNVTQAVHLALRPQAPDGLTADKKGELVGDVLNTALSTPDWICFQIGSGASLFVFHSFWKPESHGSIHKPQHLIIIMQISKAPTLRLKAPDKYNIAHKKL